TDNLADELVAHDGVPPGIPDEPGRRVRVIHVVHIRCTDRGAQRPQQQLARPWYRIGRVADLQPPVTQDHRPHLSPSSGTRIPMTRWTSSRRVRVDRWSRPP